MTAPASQPIAPSRGTASPASRAAIWVAIGAVLAAAVVCVVWVFIGSQDGIVGRAFATILLLAAFAGVGILEAHLAPRRPTWFAVMSLVGWISLLLLGAAMIWLPAPHAFVLLFRLMLYLLVILVVQLALLHIRLLVRASRRYVTVFTQVVMMVTVFLIIALAVMISAPLVTWEYVSFGGLHWRFVAATAILVAVGTILIPLVNALLAGRPAAPSVPAAAPSSTAAPLESAQQPTPTAGWPTFVDGMTPLPVMPDGQPDWGAYYTGFPSPGAYVIPSGPAPAAEPAVAPGYAGYPPPPPLPPRV